MPRKVFISFLGSTNYKECKYSKGNYVSNTVRYVQEATLGYIKANLWTENDKGYILVTGGRQGSESKNWQDNGQIDYESKNTINQTGLKTELEKLNLPFAVEDIPISDGNTESEIWGIFDTVYNLLHENDELYIDITHGFRYLPMLSIVLANYGKLLKNITVKSISYGNYESRDKKSNEAPIIDLTAFSQLQDWTNAANIFINHGNLDSLALLTKQEITPLLAKTKGKNKTASTLRNLANKFEEFSTFIKVNNVPAINTGIIFDKISKIILSLKNDLITPLNPIIEKIQEKISIFSTSNDTLNGFRAVDFCIENGLIQQAYTMLQENIVTIILEKEKKDVKNKTYRLVVTGAFRILAEKLKEDEWKNENRKNIELTNKIIRNNILISLEKPFTKLTEKRNTINHAGFNDQSPDRVFKKLGKDIISLNEEVKNIIFELTQKSKNNISTQQV